MKSNQTNVDCGGGKVAFIYAEPFFFVSLRGYTFCYILSIAYLACSVYTAPFSTAYVW